MENKKASERSGAFLLPALHALDGDVEAMLSWGMDSDLLENLARKYVWWKSPEEAVLFPHRVIAQVMNIGDYEDMQSLAKAVGDTLLRDVLRHAEAGEFNPRSWAYWHYRLGLALPGQIPAMPERKLA